MMTRTEIVTALRFEAKRNTAQAQVVTAELTAEYLNRAEIFSAAAAMLEEVDHGRQA